MLKQNLSTSTHPQQTTPPGEMKFSRMWRAVLLMGGMIAPTFAVLGLLKDGEKWSWAAYCFWVFSMVCAWACFGNTRNSKSWRERLFVAFCGFSMGTTQLLGG